MVEPQTLLVFSLAVLALLISPGPNMAFLLSHSISHGARGGLAVALGIFVADVVLTILTATGISAMIATWPPFFDFLRYVGAFYLLWLAYKALQARSAVEIENQKKTAISSIAWKAMLNSLFNPKALLFFMLFLPQFVNPANASVASQIIILGSVLTVIAFVFHTLLGIFSGAIAAYVNRNSKFARFSAWMLAAVFVALASKLILLEKPSLK